MFEAVVVAAADLGSSSNLEHQNSLALPAVVAAVDSSYFGMIQVLLEISKTIPKRKAYASKSPSLLSQRAAEHTSVGTLQRMPDRMSSYIAGRSLDLEHGYIMHE